MDWIIYEFLQDDVYEERRMKREVADAKRSFVEASQRRLKYLRGSKR